MDIQAYRQELFKFEKYSKTLFTGRELWKEYVQTSKPVADFVKEKELNPEYAVFLLSEENLNYEFIAEKRLLARLKKVEMDSIWLTALTERQVNTCLFYKEGWTTLDIANYFEITVKQCDEEFNAMISLMEKKREQWLESGKVIQ